MSKKCTPLWRKAHFEVKMYKTRQLRSTFCSSAVGKMHAAVAKSTCGNENAQNMRCLEHFCTFRCRKMAHGCAPLWRKAHFEVKMYKTRQLRSTFCSSAVEKMHAAVAKSTCGNENAQNMRCLEHFCTFRCRKMAHGCAPLWRKAHFEVKMYKTRQL